jgi:hypothetical protein
MDNFISLVEEYRSKHDIADLFGVILYTDEHANIKKVLRDEDYWESLHEITGERFCVFSVKPEKGKIVLPRMGAGSIGMMVSQWEEPRENKQLIDLFEIKNTSRLPLLLLFTEVDGEFLKIELKLSDSSCEAAFDSLRTQLRFSCDALARVKEENLKNSAGLYAALSMHEQHRAHWDLFKKGFSVLSYIKKFTKQI